MQPPPGQPPYGQPPYGYPQQYPQQQQQYPQPQQQMQPVYPQQQPYAMQQQPQQGFATGRAPTVRMSGALYIIVYVVAVLATGVLAAFGAQPATTEAIPFIPLPMVVLGIVQMVFIYKMWNAINDGHTKPTPGAALGLLFVPFFALYWIFVVWPGYATRYNAYIQRQRIQAQPLGQGLFIAALLCAWIPLVGLVLWAIVLGKVCGAVNALSPRTS
jgi:hypothetical protein